MSKTRESRLAILEQQYQRRETLDDEIEALIAELSSYEDGAACVEKILQECEAQQGRTSNSD